MLLIFCPCWFMLFSWSCQSQILDLLVIKATLDKTNFCIIGQIIYIIYISIKHQQEQSKMY